MQHTEIMMNDNLLRQNCKTSIRKVAVDAVRSTDCDANY